MTTLIMNFHLLATIDWSAYAAAGVAILLTALGLGFIIFVHELGHFAVAKMCGVKCDKFMIGFDIGGYKIGKQIGETYYGIGILPLGGYVRMMGQNDDPRMTQEQIHESEVAAGENIPTKEIVGPGGKKHTVDSRSYIAKSVPQRMAIISAGVIMNVIFAFIFATLAFRIGVPSMPAIVSATDPGAPAWQAGLRPDDEIVRIGDIDNPWYVQLQNEVTLSGKGEEIELGIKRAETGEIETLAIRPSRERLKIAQIGVQSPISLVLAGKDAARPFSPSAEVAGQIPDGGKIIAVDGTPVETYGELSAVLAANPSKTLEYTFEKKPQKKGETGERVKASIGPNRSEHVGLVMEMGPISAVQDGSPAAEAGLKVGDQIVAIDDRHIGINDAGELGWEPRTLPERLSAMGHQGQSISIEVRRASADKEDATETVTLIPRPVTWFEKPLSKKSPASVPALGIAYQILNVVDGVIDNGPASKADIQPGDRIVSVALVVPEKYSDEFDGWLESLELSADQQAWAHALYFIQGTPPGSQLELSIARAGDEKTRKVKVAIVEDEESFDPMRGTALTPIKRIRQGETFGEQAAMAWNETKRSLGSVYRFLNRIINNDIPATALGGPITIARASYLWALDGFGKLLLFMTLISANLAVVNFLPIPVLDGGHMVFLAWEGIFRRPANEMVAGILNITGLALIVCLMLFVFGLDLGLIDRNL